MAMIRSGRCDECRRMKRKCNETRPACSRCAERGVPCVYSAHVSQFIQVYQSQLDERSSSESIGVSPREDDQPIQQVVLSIRSSRRLVSGNGLYQTMRARPTNHLSQAKKSAAGLQGPTITPPPCSKVVRLQNEFGAMLHSASAPGLRMRLWGPWLEMIIPRLGRNVVLDCAASCLIAGHKATYTSDTQAQSLGQQRYVQALKALKTTVASGAGSVNADVIAATKLLMSYELLIGSRMPAWLSHAYGSVHLFHAAGPKFCRGQFERALFSHTFVQAWRQGILSNTHSVFDTPEWLDPESPPILAKPAEHAQFFNVLTRLPRLTALVRTLRADPSNKDVARRAARLASSLLCLSWRADDEGDAEASLTPTARPEDAELVPYSFSRSLTETEFVTLVGRTMLWTTKIMLSGLCQVLYAYNAPIEWPQLAELYEEEQKCAMHICMTVDLAERMQPYGVAPIMLSIQVAWGAYHWRQKEHTLHVDARGLAEWLKRRGNELMALVHYPEPMHDARLAYFNARLMGAPAVPITPEFVRRLMNEQQSKG